jgi:hypothetical protein
MSQDTQTLDLQAQIAELQRQLAEMKNELKVKKAKPVVEKTSKPYAKLNGHYFKLECDKVPQEIMSTITTQIEKILTDVETNEDLVKSLLGRCLKQQFIQKREIFFWTPNQDQLMFGPVKAGIKNAKDFELFEISPEYLTDLGPAFDGDRSGKIKLETLVKLEDFRKFEAEVKTMEKLKEKLEKMKAK